jgi:hypothetical protein
MRTDRPWRILLLLAGSQVLYLALLRLEPACGRPPPSLGTSLGRHAPAEGYNPASFVLPATASAAAPLNP